MLDKNKSIPLPLPFGVDDLPLTELIAKLKAHPDIAHVGIIMSHELDAMELKHVAHREKNDADE